MFLPPRRHANENYIAIDGGTTNTRLTLLSDGKVKEKICLQTGVKDNIESTKKYEKKFVKQ